MTLPGFDHGAWDCPPCRSYLAGAALEYGKTGGRSNQPRGPARTNYAVVHLMRLAVLQADYVNQPYKPYSECLSVSVLVRSFASLAIPLRLPDCLTWSPRVKDNDAFFTERTFLPAPVNAVLEQ